MLWKATATAEKEMQNMKHVWKRYLIVTAMTVVLGLSAGCGSAAEDTNNNQNNTQDENTPDDNENKNNTDGSQVPAVITTEPHRIPTRIGTITEPTARTTI